MIGDFDLLVEVAFNAGYLTAPDQRVWTDVSSYVETDEAGVEITRGRQDELSEVQPSACRLVLDNSDGRFTPEYAAGAYYPNVKRGRPLRVRVLYPASAPHNLLDVQNAGSLEDGTTDGWAVAGFAGYTLGTLANSTTRAVDGTRSLLVTWNGGPDPGLARCVATNLTVGRTYTVSAYVWVPSGSPDVYLKDLYTGTTSAATSLKDQWVRLSFQVVPTLGIVSCAVVADSTTSGDEVWVDGAQVSMTEELTDYSSAPLQVYDRFTGYVHEWPVQWPGVDKHSKVPVQAFSRAARLGQSAEFDNVVAEEIMAGDAANLAGVKLYFPLAEPEGATSSGNASRYPQPALEVVQAGSGGLVEFGKGTGPGTDEQSCPLFTPTDAANGSYLRMTTTPNFGNGSEADLFGTAWEASLSAFVACSTNAPQTIAFVDDPSFGSYLFIGIDAAGKLHVEASRDGSTVHDSITSTAAITDGEVHHVAIRFEASEDPDLATIYMVLDGVETAGATDTWLISFNHKALYMDRLTVGGGTVNGVGGLFTGTIAHVVVLDTPQTGELERHAEAGLTGFEGERSDERIARYARWAGIDPADYTESLDIGLAESVCHNPTAGKTPIGLMREVEATEVGMLFDAKDGTLEFQARDRRYASPVEFTIDAAAQELEADLEPRLDDQQLVNAATVNRPDGTIVHATDTASVQEYGQYKVDRTLLTTNDNEVHDYAWFLVNFYSEPTVRIPGVVVDMLNAPAAKLPDMLFADLGARFAIDGLPEHAPWESTSLFIEGTTENITATSYTMQLHTSPPLLSDVWVLDSSTLSQLDSSTVLAL